MKFKILMFFICIFLMAGPTYAQTSNLNKDDYKSFYKEKCKHSDNATAWCSLINADKKEIENYQNEMKNCLISRLPSFCTCLETDNSGCIRFKNYSKEDDKLIYEYKKKIQNEKEKKEKLDKEKAVNKKIKNTQYIKCLMENIKVNSTVSHKEVIELFCQNEVYN